jgi:hypothetical protein
MQQLDHLVGSSSKLPGAAGSQLQVMPQTRRCLRGPTRATTCEQLAWDQLLVHHVNTQQQLERQQAAPLVVFASRAGHQCCLCCSAHT